MKILLFIPLHPSRPIPASVQSGLDGLDHSVHLVDEWRLGEMEINQGAQAYDQITQKYQMARDRVLAGDYDAMMTVEYDNIIPADALTRLVAMDTDVAYGLYCCRRKFSRWLAFAEVYDNWGHSLSGKPERAAAAWGNVVETKGVGFGCTLIKRRVLEAIPFRRFPNHPASNDWQFAIDVAAAGFIQKHDCGLLVGHVVQHDPEQQIWPIGELPYYRVVVPVDNTRETRRTMQSNKQQYRCRVTIWREMERRYYQPGDLITLDDAVAAIHLRKRQVEIVEDVEPVLELSTPTNVSKRKGK